MNNFFIKPVEESAGRYCENRPELFYDNQYKDRARILISNVMNMAKQLGMVTVAEGIEEQRQIDFLRQVGCDKVQGYYFARPVPAESFWEGTRGAG